MAVEIAAWIDPKDFESFRTLKGKVRVAAAIGLTKTAKDAQAALKAEAASVFHLRRSWVPQGIRIEGANAATLNAKVGSIDKYMGRHVFGDAKQPANNLSISGTRDSNGRLATGGLLIGAYANIGDAKTHTQERSLLSRIDSQKKKTFQILSKDGKVLIVRRDSNAKGSKSLQVLASLSNTVKEKAVWHMDITVAAVVGARFMQHFQAAIDFGKQTRA